MKYIVVLGDGMADLPVPQLGDKTPLEYAKTPVMDLLAENAEIGMVKTIPTGMKPGSDTANLAVLGYDPEKYYTGRSPLEALSIGVDMEANDVAIRCNLVTLSQEEEYSEKIMIDHSSDEISTEDAEILLRAVAEKLEDEYNRFYVGTSYRHCLIRKNSQVTELTPPHDILEKKIGQYLPEDEILRKFQEKSYEILSNHPLNKERQEKGLHPANSLWFWGAGTKPELDAFADKYGKRGVMISAVDLLKGIAVGAGMGNVLVDGANGGLYTNYKGKAQAAVDALLKQGYDFAYIHVEAPDEMGHQGSVEKKIQSIEWLDEQLIKIVKEQMDESGEEYRMMILPDHPTPVSVRTHTSEPVPYLLYDSTKKEKHDWKYCEKDAAETGRMFDKGYELLQHFLKEAQ